MADKIFPANIKNIARRYLAGEATDAIGERFGNSASSIYQWLRRAGVAKRARRHGPNLARRLKIDVAQIITRYNRGETEQAISLSLGVSRPAVRRRLIEAGIRPRSYSEAQFIRMKRLTASERLRLSAAAHAAVRGKRQSEKHR